MRGVRRRGDRAVKTALGAIHSPSRATSTSRGVTHWRSTSTQWAEHTTSCTPLAALTTRSNGYEPGATGESDATLRAIWANEADVRQREASHWHGHAGRGERARPAASSTRPPAHDSDFVSSSLHQTGIACDINLQIIPHPFRLKCPCVGGFFRFPMCATDGVRWTLATEAMQP